MKNTRRDFIRTGVVAGSALVLSGTSSAGATNPPADAAADMSIWDALASRRSVRAYKPDAVPEEHIRRIIDAARRAPTAGNQQPWKFLVVRDPARIGALHEACMRRAMEQFDANPESANNPREQYEERVRGMFDKYLSAPVYIVVLTDNETRYPDYNHWDGPLAAGYLMLAARALGYGTVFLTDSIPESVTREVLAIPERYTRVCITPVGVPVDWPASPAKKDLGEFIVHEGF